MEELVALFKRVVELSDVKEIRVTPVEFFVQRLVDADVDDIIPEPSQDAEGIDPDFVLKRIADGLDQLPFDPEQHPYLALEKATRMVSERGFKPAFLFAPLGDWIAAYLGLDVDVSTVFGMRVLYSDSDTFRGKLVVVGGTTTFVSDAKCGVIIDMGISDEA